MISVHLTASLFLFQERQEHQSRAAEVSALKVCVDAIAVKNKTGATETEDAVIYS